MRNWGRIVALVVAASGAGAIGLRAQTSKNPIDTKPEGQQPTCSYSGGVSGGKVSGSNSCTPAPAPGTDPNLYVPPNAAQRFPFPAEQPAMPAAPSAQTQGGVQGSAAGSQQNPGQSATQRFPFPGEAPAGDAGGSPNAARKPAPEAPSPLKDAGGSGSSSSSSGSSSSSSSEPGYSSSSAGPDLPDDDPNAPMPTPKHHVDRRKLPPPEKVLSNDEKASEDLQVAGFYANDGNYMAAYLRSKEAVSLIPDDAEAHLVLANSARKLGKLDEAEQNYKKALSLDPVPKVKKAAEKALKEMSGT